MSKFDAARRQLATAIELWFNDKDPVSIHTLAYTSCDVIHTLSEKRGRKQTLIFDTELVNNENRKEYRIAVRAAGNFFKHGARDPEAMLNFDPLINESFIYFAILGIELMGFTVTNVERAFVAWISLQHPEWLTPEGHVILTERFPVSTLDEIREMPKSEFFNIWL